MNWDEEKFETYKKRERMNNSRVLRGRIRNFFEASSPIRDYIKNYVLDNLKNGTKSVALCFRGNAATLYYHCHQLLHIRSSRDGIIGEFDFRHARALAYAGTAV